jgi:hypothetical protein
MGMMRDAEELMDDLDQARGLMHYSLCLCALYVRHFYAVYTLPNGRKQLKC